MSHLLFSLALLIPGLLLLSGAMVLSLQVRREVPHDLLKHWTFLSLFVFAFLVGYFVFLLLMVLRVPYPVEPFVSLVFFGGVLFVFLVLHLSRYTVKKTREGELALAGRNSELELEIQARKKAEAQSHKRLQYLVTLHELDLVITASHDPGLTMRLFLEQVLPRLEMDAGAILLLNVQRQGLEYGAGTGFRTDAIEKTWELLGEGTAGAVAKERMTLVYSSIATCSGMQQRGLTGEEEGFETYCAAPLISQGQVKGVLEMFRRTLFEPDREWLDFFEAIAVQAAIAIDNATMFQNLHDSHAELILAYDTTIEGWAHALEQRDKETEGHTRRCTELTVKVARKLGIKDDELVHIRRGALLHDIGKMAVPDPILLKAEPLTEEEKQVMQQHPVSAFKLLQPIAYLRPAIDIPYCHHERWDGSGYPRGLRGEQIPLAARIFALADTWDALVFSRRYHEAWSREKAAEHIRLRSGSHFDPDLVETFLEVAAQEDTQGEALTWFI